MKNYTKRYDGFTIYAEIDEDGYICRVGFDPDPGEKGDLLDDPAAAELFEQLDQYFECRRKSFDLPLRMEGTDFQKKVWEELTRIPYGETRTYGQIAEAIGNPKASRAVGMANNRNPVAIIVPCHRVIGSDGSLTGYAGGLEIKEKLLNIEKYGKIIHKNNTN